MKIKRYTGRDMRQAMQKVREDQGPDAVILSSRRSDGMVEIVAAIDYDEALVREAVEPMRLERSPSSGALAIAPLVATAARAEPATPPLRAVRSAAVAQVPLRPTPSVVAPATPVVDTVVATVTPAATVASDVVADVRAPSRPHVDDTRIRNEIGQLRHLLESQLSSLAWNDLDRRQPLRARVLRDLTRFGIEADVANMIVTDLPSDLTSDQSRYLPLGLLSRRLRVNADAADPTGVLALVGATGAGKTTTLAKLAARHVQKHGRQSVALIGTDDYRVGAHDQLMHYGRALGVQTFAATNADELERLLTHLSDRELVLIDTPGMTLRDARLPSVIETLKSNAARVRTSLVLPANLLPAALENSVRAFSELAPTGCILTKLDEAPCSGGALSIALRHGLPLEYVTDGQRVPEDIHFADARRLVCRLADESKGDAPDEHVMAERFGRAMLARS